MSDNDFPCCAPASNLRPDSGVIERVKAVLYKKGAYCGVCDFDPEPCSECDQCLTGYAEALAAAGLLAPSDADVAERIARAIEAAGTAIETAQREVHRGYLPIVESGIVAGYSQAARIARSHATPPVAATGEGADRG